MKVSKGTRKNRILMLLENLPFPQDLRVRREAYALTSAGYHVTVICPSAKGQRSREIVNGVAVYRYPAPPSAHGFLSYLWEYAYSMAASFCLSLAVAFREGFDVVHAHNPPDTFVFIAMFYKLLGKRFVYDHHDLSPEMYIARFRRGGGSPLVHRALILFEKLSCWLADHVIVTNESYKNIAMERGRVPEEQLTVVRNGIELSRAMIPVAPDQELRKMGKTIIGYVGVMGVQDGVDYLLRALNYLLRGLSRNDFYCVIIGFGDALEDLKRLAQELALQDHVLFTGPIFGERLRQLLAAADICVDSSPANPYTDRSTMFKIMEYMSLGKPIVAFDLPEHRFTARDAAVYVPPNDERAFARALAKLMDDPDRRMALGTTGSGRIKTQLAWDYSIPNLFSAYRTVLPEAKIPQATALEAEALREPGVLEAMHPVQVSRELDADKNPRAIQPDEALSPTQQSTAFPV